MSPHAWLPFALLLLAGAASGSAPQDGSQSPSFDCAGARSTVEKTICGDPDLALADRRMAMLYAALLGKQPEPRALRNEQRRWLRSQRNRCGDRDCIATAYATRNAELQRRNQTPRPLPPWPAPPLIERDLASIDDTRVERRLDLRSATPQRLQLELHVDPQDHLDWVLPGPRVLLECTDPEHREGYAPRFRHRVVAHGVEFTPVWREFPATPSASPTATAVQPADQAYGFILMELELGRDLPLDQDIRCTAVFSEWLLDRPSTLYVVEAPGR